MEENDFISSVQLRIKTDLKSGLKAQIDCLLYFSVTRAANKNE